MSLFLFSHLESNCIRRQTYQGAKPGLWQAFTPARVASQRNSNERRDTNQLYGSITYITGLATCPKVNFLIYCETHYIKLKTMTVLCVISISSSVLTLFSSTLFGFPFYCRANSLTSTED